MLYDVPMGCSLIEKEYLRYSVVRDVSANGCCSLIEKEYLRYLAILTQTIR